MRFVLHSVTLLLCSLRCGVWFPALDSSWLYDLHWINQYRASNMVLLQNLDLEKSMCFYSYTGPVTSAIGTNSRIIKKDKMEERWITPDEFQVCETAQPRSAKLTCNCPETHADQPSGNRKNWPAEPNLNCQNMECRELNKWLLF